MNELIKLGQPLVRVPFELRDTQKSREKRKERSCCFSVASSGK